MDLDLEDPKQGFIRLRSPNFFSSYVWKLEKRKEKKEKEKKKGEK